MKTKETFLTIDPPSGWKYGFPKAVTQKQYKEIKNLKQWCIEQGYPKEEADSYADYFHIQINGDLSFMNEKISTREQAMNWWNNKQIIQQQGLSKIYFQGKNYLSLTGREIEEIWLKETQTICDESPREFLKNNPKPNQKQFKQFDESLFRAYIDKFSDEDKLKMLNVLFHSQNIKTSMSLGDDLITFQNKK